MSLSKIGNTVWWVSQEWEGIKNFILDLLSLGTSRKSREKVLVRNYKCVGPSHGEEGSLKHRFRLEGCQSTDGSWRCGCRWEGVRTGACAALWQAQEGTWEEATGGTGEVRVVPWGLAGAHKKWLQSIKSMVKLLEKGDWWLALRESKCQMMAVPRLQLQEKLFKVHSWHTPALWPLLEPQTLPFSFVFTPYPCLQISQFNHSLTLACNLSIHSQHRFCCLFWNGAIGAVFVGQKKKMRLYDQKTKLGFYRYKRNQWPLGGKLWFSIKSLV